MIKQGILVIVAHSDDQILGGGGTFAYYASQGIPVYTLILSEGQMSHPHLKKEIIIKKRITESIRANKIINSDKIFFFNLKEGQFKQGFEEFNMKTKIINIIKRYKINKIFTHSKFDIDFPNKDHISTHEFVIELAREFNDIDVYTFTVWDFLKNITQNNPVLVVDISNTIKLKLKALSVFQTQIIQFLIPLILIFPRALINGLRYKKKYVEVFIKEK